MMNTLTCFPRHDLGAFQHFVCGDTGVGVPFPKPFCLWSRTAVGHFRVGGVLLQVMEPASGGVGKPGAGEVRVVSQPRILYVYVVELRTVRQKNHLRRLESQRVSGNLETAQSAGIFQGLRLCDEGTCRPPHQRTFCTRSRVLVSSRSPSRHRSTTTTQGKDQQRCGFPGPALN